ncbi:glycosyltransferase family 2 protein [Pelomonas sp. Root1237]|uniref:glycosyltransferase family 2 protein n=1 Tax=Pelomonas sp. Root1237 TaxID=1736434 RepID=UPI0006FEEDF5|nr:glycosyltransferase family 2 protein [Pelomonas sp. Root1237]KQV85769.1 glycosyl transferase [Pelomonas sp. Root1237]
MKVCAVIPVYNHGGTVGGVAAKLREQGLPVLLVDDGSAAATAAQLDALARQDGIQLLRLPHNQGKGVAVIAGMRLAVEQGYTHGLQIDADGQHDAFDASRFVAAAQARPEALICGCPIYDASVPRARLYGRYATHIWVWINTLSFAVRDSMCGFRIYPLATTLPQLAHASMGRRMDFDTEIAVRLVWAGVPVVNQPTRVHYPVGGISHFRVWRDNVLISAMHTRLFFGMLWRAPLLLARKLRSNP